MQSDYPKPQAQAERPHPRFLTSLDASLEELQRVVPMPLESTYALEALRAGLRARSVFMDPTSALLLTKMLRGLAAPSHVDVK
jgi:adenine-specific DNA methylase